MVVSSLIVAALVFVAFGVFISLAYRQRWQWTGLPAPRAEVEGGSGRSAKTLWDWLQLLGIPVALAALAFLLNEAQTRRDELRDDQRAALQRTAASDAERENTLRAYLAQMSDLMLHEDLLQSEPEANVRNVARTATLTVVRRLDGPRRGLVVRFLAEAGFADFRDAQLSRAELRGAYLSGADFSGANLRAADLRGANLRSADLDFADLRKADLSAANLLAANLRKANLSGANFRGARDAVLADTQGTPAHGP